jgi:hypothetical protein
MYVDGHMRPGNILGGLSDPARQTPRTYWGWNKICRRAVTCTWRHSRYKGKLISWKYRILLRRVIFQEFSFVPFEFKPVLIFIDHLPTAHPAKRLGYISVSQPPGRGPVPGPRLIDNRIYQAAVWQMLRTTGLHRLDDRGIGLWGLPSLLYKQYRGLFPGGGGKAAGSWSWPLTSI